MEQFISPHIKKKIPNGEPENILVSDPSKLEYSQKVRLRYDASIQDFSTFLEQEPMYRIKQIWDGLYTQHLPLEDITTLPKKTREKLLAAFPSALAFSQESKSHEDDYNKRTIKWLWKLHDNRYIETVLMHYPKRVTVCVSTQAGCAMACSFCATGQAGFDRQLTSGEIVEQVMFAIRAAEPHRVSNIVFMGMGEPLANYDQMWKAILRLHDDVGISARHLTVSTVGIIPGILRIAQESLPVNLAISLHAANDTLRNELVPINKKYPLDALQKACQEYKKHKNRRLSFEWAMIDGINDSIKDAQELATFVKPLQGHINLIPLNRTPGYDMIGSTNENIKKFVQVLENNEVRVTVRQNRGTDIDAACGQLRASQVIASSHLP